MSTRFDLIDLRLFVHVAEAGSITHGAVRANMTLASASERIRAMEDALSAPLLERKRRGVQLTSAGRVLLHHAWVVTQQLEQMRGELANFGKGLRGHDGRPLRAHLAGSLLPAITPLTVLDHQGTSVRGLKNSTSR
jgi:molybdate transport repressor ModE-like protein